MRGCDGDTINTAARLEFANKHLGTRLCVSAVLAARVPDFRGRLIGDLVLKGRTETIRTFDPLRVEQYNPFAKPPAVLGRLKAVERILE